MLALLFLPDLLGSTSTENIDFKVFGGEYVLFSLNSITAKSIQCVIFILLALFYMDMCLRLSIVPLRSAIPFVIATMIFGSINYFQYFNNETAAFLLFVLSVRQLLLMYNRSNQYSSAFNISFLITLASILQPEYILMMPAFLIGFVVFSTFSFRSFLAFLCGIIMVAFIVFACFYISDNPHLLLDALSHIEYYDFSIIEFKRTDIILGISLLLFTLLSIISYFTKGSIYKLNVRVNFVFINIINLYSILWIMMIEQICATSLLVPCLFMTFLLSLYLSTNDNKVSNIGFVCFLVLCIAYRIMWIVGY